MSSFIISRILSRSRCLSSKISFKLLQPRREFQVASVNFFKKFQNIENEFNYGILERKFKVEMIETPQLQVEYSDEIIEQILKAEDWSSKSSLNVLSEFKAVASYCAETNSCISEDRFAAFVKGITKKFSELSDQELSILLTDMQLLPETPGVNTKNFLELWSALDNACLERVIKWNHEQLLYFANHWYKLNLAKNGEYTYAALRKISRRFRKLNEKTLVQTMFFINLCRKSLTNMFDIEVRFNDYLDELTIDEIGIVCVAFFKTETKFHNMKLIERIYRRTVESLENIESITLVNILKALRYSSQPTHAKSMAELSNKLLENIDKYSLMTKLHIGLLGTNIQYCHDGVVDSIVRHFLENIKSTRLKDIERIAFIIGLNNFQAADGAEKELCWKIVEQLKDPSRISEILKYPKCFSSCVYYLTLSGVYDVELIESVLKEKFIHMTYSRNHTKIGREIIALDSYARINLKDIYTGTHLSDKMRKNIAKYSSHYIPYRNQPYKLTHSDRILLEVQQSAENLYGSNMITHVLPHFERPDVILCFDENKNPITKDIMNCFPEPYSGEILFKNSILSKVNQKEDCRMIAFVVGGWNFFVRDTEKLTGVLKMKIEQLKLIGYEPVLVEWFKWAKLSTEQKAQFVKDNVEKILY